MTPPDRDAIYRASLSQLRRDVDAASLSADADHAIEQAHTTAHASVMLFRSMGISTKHVYDRAFTRTLGISPIR